MFTMQVDSERVIAKMQAREVGIPKALANVVTALSYKLYAAVMNRAPVQTGKLRASIGREVVANKLQAIATIKTGKNIPYAKFVEYGTKAHDIVPTKAKALNFMMGGKQVFFKKVRHPGTKAMLYVHGPFEEMKPEIIARIEAAMHEALK